MEPQSVRVPSRIRRLGIRGRYEQHVGLRLSHTERRRRLHRSREHRGSVGARIILGGHSGPSFQHPYQRREQDWKSSCASGHRHGGHDLVKPTLTVQDFGGKLSEDMEATRLRLLRGGSWKKQRVVVVIPAAENIPAQVALTWWNMIFPPNNAVVRILAQGMEVGDAYSTAIDQIIQHPDLSQFEYVLTLEHDNTPPADGLLKLLQDMEEHPEFDCIGGLYFTKGEGG